MLKISVIIPAFNAEKTILQCLTSVINQTYEVYEIVIIDDGSSDDTLHVVQEFCRSTKITKIVLLSQTNSGPSSARNYGMQTCKGDWIAFLDSDDCWHETKIEVQAKLMSSNGGSFCGTAYPKALFDVSTKIKLINFQDLCKRNYFTTSTVFVKKIIIADIPFDESQKYSEDYGVWLIIASRVECFYINMVLSKNIFNKQVFGDEGLSAHIWQMELGELRNFFKIYRLSLISFLQLSKYCGYSLLKFLRRCCISAYFKIVRTV